MSDSNAMIGAMIPVAMPGLVCIVGRVEVGGFWHLNQPRLGAWRTSKPVHNQSWQTTHLPDQHSGKF